MSTTYAEHRPTVFDNHLEIDWEPSGELEKLRSDADHLWNRLEDARERDSPIACRLEHEYETANNAAIELERAESRENWIVAPVSRNRDSGPLDESNFASALELLGGESESCEVHRFGHWGPGWYEIIIVHPSRAREIDDLESSLESYPVLNLEYRRTTGGIVFRSTTRVGAGVPRDW